jgi:hypothetical protein
MYHIKMLQSSCYGISNYRIRLRKSCLQLEKIVTLDLVSTDLEYCSTPEHCAVLIQARKVPGGGAEAGRDGQRSAAIDPMECGLDTLQVGHFHDSSQGFRAPSNPRPGVQNLRLSSAL